MKARVRRVEELGKGNGIEREILAAASGRLGDRRVGLLPVEPPTVGNGRTGEGWLTLRSRGSE